MTKVALPAVFQNRLVVPLLLALVTLLVYANSFPGAYIMDDIHIVQNNPMLAKFDLWRIFHSEYWQGIESNGLYRPLSILSFAFNRLLFGTDAWGFHLINVLLHASVSILSWRMLLRWDFTPLQALLTSLLFAVHPIHTEVVNQMVGRSELLAALFMLLALTSARGAGIRPVLLTCAFFLAALLSKENAVTLLLLLPLLDCFVAQSPRELRRRLPFYGMLFGVVVIWFLWRKYGITHDFPATVLSPEVTPLAFLPWDGRFLSALQLQGLYLGKLFLPFGLQATYAASDLPEMVPSLLSWRGLLLLAAFLLILSGIAYAWRRRHPIGLLAALYLTSFILTANLFIPIGVTFAERLAYFPSLWFCAGIAFGFAEMIRSSRRLQVAGSVAFGGYLLVLAMFSLARNPDFSSEMRYWKADLRQNPQDHLALVVYAELLAAESNYPAAEAAYQKLWEIAPTFAYGYRSRTNYLINQRRFEEALEASGKALTLARTRGDRAAMGYDLGDQAKIYLELKDYARALALLNEGAEALGRDNFDLSLRERALAGLGRHEDAAQALRRGKDTGTDAKVLYEQALKLFQEGRLVEARARLEESSRHAAVGAESWNLLGAICGQLGDLEGELTAFEQAVRLAPDNRYYAENLRYAREKQKEKE